MPYKPLSMHIRWRTWCKARFLSTSSWNEFQLFVGTFFVCKYHLTNYYVSKIKALLDKGVQTVPNFLYRVVIFKIVHYQGKSQ